MDGRAMFPKGWHPQAWDFLPSGKAPRGDPRTRTAVGGVRYYFIDFGIASQNKDMVVGFDGQERAPELSDTEPYDPYKLDVYVLGMVYQHFIVEVSSMTPAP